jgi:hypothetical protein
MPHVMGAALACGEPGQQPCGRCGQHWSTVPWCCGQRWPAVLWWCGQFWSTVQRWCGQPQSTVLRCEMQRPVMLWGSLVLGDWSNHPVNSRSTPSLAVAFLAPRPALSTRKRP